MKRVFCSILALLVSFSAYGNHGTFHIFNQDNKPFFGLYIGVEAGEVINQTKFFIDSQTPQPGPVWIDRLQHDAHEYSNHFLGTVFAGYSHTFDSKFLELQVAAAHANRNNTTRASADDRFDNHYLSNKTKLRFMRLKLI